MAAGAERHGTTAAAAAAESAGAPQCRRDRLAALAPAGDGPQGDAIFSPHSASSLRRLAAAWMKREGGRKD